MFNVTAINLTSDLRTAQPDLGACDFGQVDAGQLVSVLEAFRAIDAIQNHDAEPQIVIEGKTGKFIVRTGSGKLFLYNARDTSIPYVEMDAASLVRELSGPVATVEEEPEDFPAAPRKFQHAVAIAILAAGLVLNAYTVYSVFYVRSVDPKPPVELVTDPREVVALQGSAHGRYATGNDTGDRIIEVGADGRVRFLRVVPSGERPESTDTYRIGRTDGKLCLSTGESGVVEISNIETLVYYHDLYHRVR